MPTPDCREELGGCGEGQWLEHVARMRSRSWVVRLEGAWSQSVRLSELISVAGCSTRNGILKEDVNMKESKCLVRGVYKVDVLVLLQTHYLGFECVDVKSKLGTPFMRLH